MDKSKTSFRNNLTLLERIRWDRLSDGYKNQVILVWQITKSWTEALKTFESFADQTERYR